MKPQLLVCKTWTELIGTDSFARTVGRENRLTWEAAGLQDLSRAVNDVVIAAAAAAVVIIHRPQCKIQMIWKKYNSKNVKSIYTKVLAFWG